MDTQTVREAWNLTTGSRNKEPIQSEVTYPARGSIRQP
jgi:hypothetical protein